MSRLALTACIALSAALAAPGAETDQFMTWNIELKDSAPALNAYLNTAAQEFVERRNRSNLKVETAEEMAIGYYLYLFQGLHSSRVRSYLTCDPAIDRYPRADVSFWEYQRQSIYRGLSFPYVMPMARTVRIGDVYCGIDKIGHFFGFGRRYFQRYLRMREEGVSHEEATERVMAAGVAQETGLVGALVDGIFSHGDLEANFQGFQLLLHLTRKESPYFVNENGHWRTSGTVDITPFVTPAFDESYLAPHFTYFRRRKVEPRLKETLCAAPEKIDALNARFARYEAHPPSEFTQYLQRQYETTQKAKYQLSPFQSLCTP